MHILIENFSHSVIHPS